jgi:hypothetical protein
MAVRLLAGQCRIQFQAGLINFDMDMSYARMVLTVRCKI